MSDMSDMTLAENIAVLKLNEHLSGAVIEV